MRRVKLLGGSYEHPDGYIELDFEAEAGIVRGDNDEVKEAKLSHYYAKQAKGRKTTGAVLLGCASYFVTNHLGMDWTTSLIVAGLIVGGVRMLVN
jgi:hypothetical protein